METDSDRPKLADLFTNAKKGGGGSVSTRQNWHRHVAGLPMEDGSINPNIEEKPDESKRFAVASAKVSKSFRRQGIELSAADIRRKRMIPSLGVKLVKPGSKLAEFRIGK